LDFWLVQADSSGGGGGIRTCDQGLMSSWPWRSLVFGAIRPCAVFGGNKPKVEVSGCPRPGAVCRERREMDVKMDVHLLRVARGRFLSDCPVAGVEHLPRRLTT